MQAVRQNWRLALASGAAFLFVALASDFVVHRTSGLTAIWPCNAVTLALLIVRGDRRDRASAIIAGAFAGSLLSCVLRLQPILPCLLFPIANTLESALATAIIRRSGGIAGPFDRVANVVALVVTCLVAPLLPALIGAGAIHLTYGGSLVEGWLNWYGAAMLGLAVVTPGVVVGLRLWHARTALPGGWRLAEAGLILGLVAMVAIAVFYLASIYLPAVPLLFVLFPCLTLATFRLRQLGAVTSILIVTLIGAQATVHGFGPIAHAAIAPGQELLFLQIFLATTFLSALPVAAALAERDARAAEARALADRFRIVVENVDKVIFRIDHAGTWTYLNPAWEQVTGYPVAESLGRAWTERVEIERPGELAEWIEPVLGGEVGGSSRLLRFTTANQGVRWMEMSIQLLRDGTGLFGATGTLRDVDDRKRLDDNVLLAKRNAEERARDATLLAATDELTGIANRRAFGRHLEHQIVAAARSGGRLAVAIFDVDHFKQVNDRHGHAVGDRVLQRVALRALGVVRSGDVVGRLGGEEFGILMPGASLEDAQAAAERLRETIQASSRPDEEPLPTVTVSVGIAAARDAETADALLNAADRALYAAKNDGRNRVKIAA